MKKLYCLFYLMLILTLVGCQSEDELGPTQIDTSTKKLSGLDQYLRDNFVEPYNIEIQYKWDINEVNDSRILYPPHLKSVKPMADALKKVWIDSYSEVAGDAFIKNIAPRQFTFVGSFNFNKSATILLGLAEAGTKVSLFNIDFIDYSSMESIRRPMHTIQHEYTHILNQNKPFNPDFKEVNPENYTAQWFNNTDAEANEMGHITAYATSDPNEDFAEMVSYLLTHSDNEYHDLLQGISTPQAREDIKTKEVMVKEYFQKEWDIDFDALQAAAFQNLIEVTE